MVEIIKDCTNIKSPVFYIKRLLKFRKFIFILVVISVLAVNMGFFRKVSIFQPKNPYYTQVITDYLHIQLLLLSSVIQQGYSNIFYRLIMYLFKFSILGLLILIEGPYFQIRILIFLLLKKLHVIQQKL